MVVVLLSLLVFILIVVVVGLVWDTLTKESTTKKTTKPLVL